MNNQPLNKPYNETDLMLLREASIASMSIGIGLTQIGKYNFAQEGYFYNALFSVCTGIERTLKLIMIYDYRLHNDGKFPGNSTLRSFGHNLSDLLKRAIEIEAKYGIVLKDDENIGDKIYEKIIPILTDFAVRARYYNLDFLTGQQQVGREPLERWNSEVCAEILSRHYKPRPERLAGIKNLGRQFDSFSSILHIAEGGEDIQSATEFLLLSDQISVKQKYSKYYLFVLIRFFCDLLAQLEFKGGFYPFLRELFMVFMNHERTYILNKKSWNPYPPYTF